MIMAEVKAIVEEKPSPCPLAEFNKSLLSAQTEKANVNQANTIRAFADAVRVLAAPPPPETDKGHLFIKARTKDNEKNCKICQDAMKDIKRAVDNMPDGDPKKLFEAFIECGRKSSNAVARRLLSPIAARFTEATGTLRKELMKVPDVTSEKLYVKHLSSAKTSSACFADWQKALEKAQSDLVNTSKRIGFPDLYKDMDGMAETLRQGEIYLEQVKGWPLASCRA